MRSPISQRNREPARLVAGCTAILSALAASAPPALAASAPKPAAPKPSAAAGFTVTKILAAPASTQSCDDLGFLNGNLFMGCQNATLSGGGGGTSTLVEASPAGTVIKTWAIKDKIDGLAGDPMTHKVIVTLNEDANTRLATVAPSAPASQQVTYYSYSPSPQSSSAPPALRSGGGTDHVSVDSAGNVLVTGSHARLKTGSAVFRVQLTPPSGAGGTGTAKLSPTFPDDATAANGISGKGPVKLKLGDVDSGAIVPRSSPRFGGGYVIDDQTALTLVFAQNLFSGTGITALKTPYGLDDITWATSNAGTLYVVDDGGTTTKGTSSIYKVTGPFTSNMVLAANDGLSDQVDKVNLTTGGLTPLVRHLGTTKGLVYVNQSGSQTPLALNEAPTAAASSSSSKGGSSNAALIVVIVVVVLGLLGGAVAIMRRRRPAA
ncbi:MAG: hypothetical protein M3Z27_01000 [Actinomycetota bacterium]|nr:hypothetical protein [Actinomycetota bacterium]